MSYLKGLIMLMVLNGREVRVGSIELEGVHGWDYPDFCDAFIAHAEFVDGTELTEDEKQEVETKYPEQVNMLAHESFH